jgi:hypothetical protein
MANDGNINLFTTKLVYVFRLLPLYLSHCTLCKFLSTHISLLCAALSLSPRERVAMISAFFSADAATAATAAAAAAALKY